MTRTKWTQTYFIIENTRALEQYAVISEDRKEAFYVRWTFSCDVRDIKSEKFEIERGWHANENAWKRTQNFVCHEIECTELTYLQNNFASSKTYV